MKSHGLLYGSEAVVLDSHRYLVQQYHVRGPPCYHYSINQFLAVHLARLSCCACSSLLQEPSHAAIISSDGAIDIDATDTGEEWIQAGKGSLGCGRVTFPMRGRAVIWTIPNFIPQKDANNYAMIMIACEVCGAFRK